MDAREVKKVIEASIFNPSMRKDAKDFIDAQAERITALETALKSYRLDHKTDSYEDDCTCELCQDADKALKGTS